MWFREHGSPSPWFPQAKEVKRNKDGGCRTIKTTLDWTAAQTHQEDVLKHMDGAQVIITYLFHTAQAGLKHIVELRLTLNFCSSCFHFQRITDMHHHAQFYVVVGAELGLLKSQTSTPPSHTLSPNVYRLLLKQHLDM